MMSAGSVNYFGPPRHYLWQWSEDGSAVEWEDGTTICLWMELHALLNHMAPQGLPPLGSILLVLMACGKRQTTALTSAREFAARATAGDQASAGSRRLLVSAGNVLESIAALPEVLRSGLSARAHLLTLVFERVPSRLTPEGSGEMLLEMNRLGLPRLGRDVPSLTGVARLLRDLKALASIHDLQDLTNLETLLRTGLEFADIQPAELPEIPLPPGGTTLPLLRQLEQQTEHELSTIAAVARRMVAMFTVPRPAGFPQELPVGGISDITNRGPLDRLLPSELAADDAILMARLANHEALYFRRDTPPDDPSGCRLILLDSGIHLWGLPRLYALAAALGFKSSAGEDAVKLLLREGDYFQQQPLETVSDVRGILERLLPDPDAAPALTHFVPGSMEERRPDVFFLTAAEPRRAVRRALHELACRTAAVGGRLYVLLISRSGALELSAHTPAGSRSMNAGRIDPDEILKEPRSPQKSAQPARDRLTDLPAIIRHLDFYRQFPLPFRFPATPLSPSNDFHFAHWRINVDTRRRLMMWDDNPLHGAGEIASELPPAQSYHINRLGGEWIVLCSGSQPGDKPKAVCLGMKTPTRREVRLDAGHSFPLWMKCLNGAALLGYSDEVEACSLTDGVRLHHLALSARTKPESVVFDGRQLGLATDPPEKPPARPPARDIPVYPSILAAPVSAGFVASGTLVIRAQGGRWELAMPDFVFTASQKSQLAAVRAFRPVSPEQEGSDSHAVFYEAEWQPDCRLIFDPRGLLHLVFADRQGRVELTLLCLLAAPVAGWVAHWPRQTVGNADWILNSSAADLRPAQLMVPLLQRFAALARNATSVHDGKNFMA